MSLPLVQFRTDLCQFFPQFCKRVGCGGGILRWPRLGRLSYVWRGFSAAFRKSRQNLDAGFLPQPTKSVRRKLPHIQYNCAGPQFGPNLLNRSKSRVSNESVDSHPQLHRPWVSPSSSTVLLGEIGQEVRLGLRQLKHFCIQTHHRRLPDEIESQLDAGHPFTAFDPAIHATERAGFDSHANARFYLWLNTDLEL